MKLKKILSIFICAVMIMCNTLSSFANNNDELETTESALVDQLKIDLGEEKVNEILNSSEIFNNEEKIFESEKLHDDIVEEEIEKEISKTCADDSKEEFVEEPEEDVLEEKEKKSIDVCEENFKDEFIRGSEDNTVDALEVATEDILKNETISDENMIADGSCSIDDLNITESTDVIASMSEMDDEALSLKLMFETAPLFGSGNSYIFPSNWVEGSGIEKQNITKLSFQKGGTLPSGTEWDIGSSGLKGYLDGTEAVIYTADSDDEIYAEANSSRLFSAHVSGSFADAPQMALTEIYNLSYLNTSNVKNMNEMFLGCSNLTDIDLSNFDTSNVQDFGYMFYNCASLTAIDVSNFVTSNAINMGAMFQNCSSLSSIDISNFDYSKIDSENHTDYSTFNLTFSENSATALMMGAMFQGCTNISTINMGNVNASNCRNFAAMFWNCSSLTTINYTGFDMSSAISLNNMFSGCSSLTFMDLSQFNTSNVEYASFLFKDGRYLVVRRFQQIVLMLEHNLYIKEEQILEMIYGEIPKDLIMIL